MHHTNYKINELLPNGDTFVFRHKLYRVAAHDDSSGPRCRECALRNIPCVETPSCARKNNAEVITCCTFQETTEPEELYALLRLKGEIS